MLLFIGIHTFSGEGDSVLFDVDVLDPYLDDVSGLEEVGGVLYESV